MAEIIRLSKNKFKEDKPFSEKILETNEFLVIHFYLKKGQKIPMHTSPSTVFVSVLKGTGIFFYQTENQFKELKTGDSIKYEPEEPHGFKALDDMIVQAVIVPKPIKKVKIT